MIRLENLKVILLVCMGIAPCLAETPPPLPGNLLELERVDVAVFRDKFLNVDRAYTAETRKLAEQRLARIENASRPLSPIDFYVELCRIAALADNAHTNCMPAKRAMGTCREFAILDGNQGPGCELHTPDFTIPEFNRVPIFFFPFGTDFHINGAPENESDLLGARLAAIDGHPIQRALPIVRSFNGGPVTYRDLTATDVLSSPNQLHSVGLTRKDDQVTYRLVLPNGRKVERTFTVESGTPAGDRPIRFLPPQDRAPWAFQDRDKRFRWKDAPELDAVIIQLRAILDDGDRTIASFLEEAETTRAKLGRRNVILDLRFNGGGNLMLTREFATAWPRRVSPPGRFYVLVSRRTQSAAIATAAFLEQAGKDRVVFVGEPPGDRLMFFSEARPVQLPHSGLFFRPTTARTDLHTGCATYDDCFVGLAPPGHAAAPLLVKGIKAEEVARMPVAIETMDPDIPAPWTIQSWMDGTDPAIEAIAKAQR